MSYLGPALDVPRFFAELPPAAQSAGFAVEKYGEATGWPLLALKRAAAHADAPVIYLSSGIHGDEPAGPLALLQLLREKYFTDHFHWLIFPALNPGGLQLKSRENPAGIDVNRDYREPKSPEARQHLEFLRRESGVFARKLAVSILLHEDWESHGFYLYELNRTDNPLLGPAVLAAVEPICGVDLSPIIEGMPAQNGLITRPVSDFADRPLWPEALWLVIQRTDRNTTLEAPSAQPLEKRVAALCAAVRTAVAEVASTKLT
jgi:hypothetical protein